jgi:hypothetical protein
VPDAAILTAFCRQRSANTAIGLTGFSRKTSVYAACNQSLTHAGDAMNSKAVALAPVGDSNTAAVTLHTIRSK